MFEAFHAQAARTVELSQPQETNVRVASLSSPSPRRTKSFLNARAVYGPSQLSLFTLLCCLGIAFLPIPLVVSQSYDSANQRVSYYPESLMISRNSKALIFYGETLLVNVHAQLDPSPPAKLLSVNNTCSPTQRDFFNKILHSARVIQGVLRRLSSLQGITNLIECDKYLRRFYRYSTGLMPTMICPKAYRSSLIECKTWALDHCSRLSHRERTWLRHRSRHLWMCHAGVFGLFRALYEASGKSCEPNHIPNLKESLHDVYDSLGDLRDMIKVVNGKTVVLIKANDDLHSKVSSLIQSLYKLGFVLNRWKDIFNSRFDQYDCFRNTFYEFTSKHATQITRVLIGILRLF